MTTRRRSAQIDPFDDRPWDMTEVIVEPRSRQAIRQLSVVSLSSWSTLGALVLVVATHLPWYRADGFFSGSRFTPQDHFLSVGTPGTAPGTTAWGHLIARGALGLTVVAVLALGVAAIVQRRRPGAAIASSAVLALSATAVLIAVVLELHARPPYGDSPALRADLGADLGAVAASLCCVAAWCAVAISVHSAVTSQDR